MLNDTLLSARSSTAPHGNVLHEFVSEPRLIAKHEKKYEWTKQGIMALYDNLNNIKTYNSLLDEPGCKFWINEKGYQYFKFFPLFKSEYLFDKRYTMDQVIQAVHDPIRRAKWDKNVDEVRTIRTVGRVQLVQSLHTPHFLESIVRDMFEKKFGFTHRPPIASRFDDQVSNGKSLNQDETLRSLDVDDGASLGRNSYKYKSDQIEYYMFSSSIDHKEMQPECPLQQDHVRTQVYLTLQKFELVKVVDPAAQESKGKSDVADKESMLGSVLRETTPTETESLAGKTEEQQPARRGRSEKKQKRQRQEEKETYQVKMTGFLQCDPKLSKLKYGLYRTALPSYTRDFYSSLVQYLASTTS